MPLKPQEQAILFVLMLICLIGMAWESSIVAHHTFALLRH
jgi:hypothetical protein